jgi:hypothetical protein
MNMGSFTLQVTDYKDSFGKAFDSSAGKKLADKHGLTTFIFGAVEAEEQNNGRKLYSTTIKASDTKSKPKDAQEVEEILTAFEKALQKDGVPYSVDRTGTTPIVNVVLGKPTQEATRQNGICPSGFALHLSVPFMSIGSLSRPSFNDQACIPHDVAVSQLRNPTRKDHAQSRGPQDRGRATEIITFKP